MICIKCGHSNPGGLNYCQQCNAYLVKMGGVPAATSSIDVEEGKEYLTPQRRYPTEYLYNLTCRAYEYIHQGASGDPLLEAYQVVRSHMDEFEANGLPVLLQEFESEKLDLPEDDYSRQMIYLLNKGVSMYREGYDLMEQFIQTGENQTLVDAVTRMQDGNDHLGLAGELAQLRTQQIEQEMTRIAMQERQEQQASPSPDAPAPTPGEPRGTTAQQRVDSARKI